MQNLATAGGLLFLLTFFHFIFDWVPQNHEEATTKSKDSWVRALHVSLYTSLMLIPMAAMFWHFPPQKMTWYCISSYAVTWVTHFIGDSYLIVFAWAKYVRKIPPELQTPKEPLTLILAIVIDQLWHIAWLGVPVALAVWG